MTGSWGAAVKIANQSTRLKKAIDHAVAQEAHQIRRDIIKGITEQAPGGRAFDPLSQLTLALRKVKGFRGKKILIVTAGLRNSVTVNKKATGKYWVGVQRSARSKDGKSLANVAAVQELGATVVVRVTPKMKKFLMMALRKSGIGTREKGRDRGGRFKKSKFVASGAGQITSGVLVIKIPARPFMRPVIERAASNPVAVQRRFTQRIAQDMGIGFGVP